MNLRWKTCLKIGASIFLLYLCITYWPNAEKLIGLMIGAAMPLFIGCVIAYLVNLLMSRYERWWFPHSEGNFVTKSRRPVCMLAAFLTLVAVLFLVGWLITPQLTACVQLILAELPGYLTKVVAWLGQFEVLPEHIISALSAIDWQSKVGQIVQMLTNGIGNVAGVVISTVASVFSGIVTAVVGIVFAIYLLAGKERLSVQWNKLTHRYLPETWCRKSEYVLGVTNRCFRKYIVGQCTEAVILGLLCAGGMMLLRLPYATMVGALVAVTALIPIVGAFIGAFVGAFMILTVSPVQALVFLVFFVVLQQLEGNIIYPKVVGASLGLPGIWVLAAVTVGGGVLGVGGMLLGVPLAATIYCLIRDDVNRNETE